MLPWPLLWSTTILQSNILSVLHTPAIRHLADEMFACALFLVTCSLAMQLVPPLHF